MLISAFPLCLRWDRSQLWEGRKEVVLTYLPSAHILSQFMWQHSHTGKCKASGSGRGRNCRSLQWRPTPALSPGKSHGWRSLVGCGPWGREESDTTERLPFHFSLSCTGEGDGNPVQCSCLENPRDKGAWWAAIYGVAQSRTLQQPQQSITL